MTEPTQDRPKYIAFSGGVESTAMSVIWGGEATAIFTDTGWEHAVLYERIDEVERVIREQHHPDFKIIRLQAGDGLKEYIRKMKFFPSFNARFCTRMFKIEPMDDFLAELGEVELFIGLNAEEGDRVGNHGLKKNVNYRYPLIENGITRDACIEIISKANLMPSFPAYMQRGGCIGCFFKTKKEYEAMALLNPEEAYGVADLEDEVQDARGEHYGVRDGIPNMRRFLDISRSQCLIDPKEMYTTEEAARMTGRAQYTVRTWIRDGRLIATRVSGSGPRGRLLIPRDELRKLIATGRGEGLSGLLG